MPTLLEANLSLKPGDRISPGVESIQFADLHIEAVTPKAVCVSKILHDRSARTAETWWIPKSQIFVISTTSGLSRTQIEADLPDWIINTNNLGTED